MENFWDSCCPALRYIQFLEELADSAVTVPAWQCPPDAQLRQAYGAIRTAITEDNEIIFRDADLYGFTLLVTAVIDGIGHGFFYGNIRKILNPCTPSTPAPSFPCPV